MWQMQFSRILWSLTSKPLLSTHYTWHMASCHADRNTDFTIVWVLVKVLGTFSNSWFSNRLIYLFSFVWSVTPSDQAFIKWCLQTFIPFFQTCIKYIRHLSNLSYTIAHLRPDFHFSGLFLLQFFTDSP